MAKQLRWFSGRSLGQVIELLTIVEPKFMRAALVLIVNISASVLIQITRHIVVASIAGQAGIAEKAACTGSSTVAWDQITRASILRSGSEIAALLPKSDCCERKKERLPRSREPRHGEIPHDIIRRRRGERYVKA